VGDKVRRLLLLVVVAALGLLLFVGGATAGVSATFDSTPAEGPPGTLITVSSVTPCPPNPSGVEGPPIVRVVLSKGGQELASVDLPVDASGNWSGSLVVPDPATPGGATLEASCLSSATAEGTTLNYEPRTFTVSAIAAPPTPPAPTPPAPVAAAPRLTG
jgi:hypothetical protein